jgi:Uncharacterized protein conserved in archaea
MPTLNTGGIIAGAYADKVRRTLFALTKEAVSQGLIKQEDVAYASAILNQLLYKILVEELKCDKGDMVRIVIDYEIKDGKIVWDYDKLKIEWFVRQDQGRIDEAVRKKVEEFKQTQS